MKSTIGIIARIFSIVLLAALNTLSVFVLIPLMDCVVRNLIPVYSSSAAAPAAFDAIRQYVATDLLGGFWKMQSLFSIYSALGWALVIAINVAIIMFFRKLTTTAPNNPILDAQPKAVEGNISGDAYFLRTEKQFAEEAPFETRSIQGLSDPEGGLYVGCSPDGKNVHIAVEDEHMLVLAPTRVGKSRRLIIEMIATLGLSDESMFVFDPKGELYGYTYEYLKEHGYLINRIDFDNPTMGNWWNPLYRAIDAYKRMNEIRAKLKDLKPAAGDVEGHAERNKLIQQYRDTIQEAEEEVSTVTALVFPRDREHEGGEAFWNNGGENYIRLALHTVCSYPGIPDSQRTIQTALILLEEYGTPQPLYPDRPKGQDFFWPLEEMVFYFPSEHPAFKAWKHLETSEEHNKSNFRQTAQGAISKYSSYALSQMMRGTDIRIEDLCTQKTATFVIVPENRKEYKEFAKLYINQVYSLLADRAGKEGGRLPRRMTMFAEELGQLPTIDDLDEILSISGGRGIRWVLVLQDLSKINQKYGRDCTPVIEGNCAYQIVLETADVTTQRYISEKLGTYTIRYSDDSHSKSPMSFFNDRMTTGEHTTSRPLLYPAEIDRWRVEYGGIVMHRGYRPAIVQMPDISKTGYQELLGLGDRAHNLRKIAEAKAVCMHADDPIESDWRPEYGDANPFDLSDEELKRKRAKWLKNMRFNIYKRNGESQKKAPATKKKASQPKSRKKPPEVLPGQTGFDLEVLGE